MKHLVILFFIALWYNSSAQTLVSNTPGEVANNKPNEVTNYGDMGVDLFQGTFQYVLPLGSVSTFSGLSYSLSLSYSSTLPGGIELPVLNGIPYGSGWNLNVPTVETSADPLNFYREEDIDLFQRQDEEIIYDENGSNEHPPASQEGRLHWHSPIINIPGVYSGRVIYTEKRVINETDAFVFIPAKFEQYFEALLFVSNTSLPVWEIYTDNGNIYRFELKIINHTQPLNTRVKDSILNIEIFRNILLPKTAFQRWYCTSIKNTNITIDQINFHYLEYSKDLYTDLTYGDKDRVNTALFQGESRDFPLSNMIDDIVLEKVSSNKEELVLEYMEMIYDFEDISYNSEIYNQWYRKSTMRQYGNNINNNTIWRQYFHARSSSITPCFDSSYDIDIMMDKKNPYATKVNSQYHNLPNPNPDNCRDNDTRYYTFFKQSTFLNRPAFSRLYPGNDPYKEYKFDAFYIESDQMFADWVPGDNYLMNYMISAGNTEQYPATIDINVLSYSPMLFNPDNNFLTPWSETLYMITDKKREVANSRNSIFNSFNSPFKKYASSYPSKTSFYLNNSNNHKERGLVIQFGPGQADLFYNRPSDDLGYPDNGKVCSEYASIYTQNTNKFKMGYPAKQCFGIGAPYRSVDKAGIFPAVFCNVSPLPTYSVTRLWWNIKGGMFDFNVSACTNQPIRNQPTIFCETDQLITKLQNMKIERITNRPMVLKRVEKRIKKPGENVWTFDTNMLFFYNARKDEKRYMINGVQNGFKNEIFLTEVYLAGDHQSASTLLSLAQLPFPAESQNDWPIMHYKNLGQNSELLKWIFHYRPISIEAKCPSENQSFENGQVTNLNANKWIMSEVIDPFGFKTKIRYKKLRVRFCNDKVLDNHLLPYYRTEDSDNSSYLMSNSMSTPWLGYLAYNNQSGCDGAEISLSTTFSFTSYYVVDSLIQVSSVGERATTYEFLNRVYHNDVFGTNAHLTRNKKHRITAGFEQCIQRGPEIDEDSGAKSTYNYLHYVDYPLIGKMKEIKKFDFYNIEKERSEFNYNYIIAKNGYTGSQNAPDFHHVSKFFDVPLFYESRTNLVGYNMPSFYLISYRIKLEKEISTVFEGNKSIASETEYQYYDDPGYPGFNLSYKLFKKIYTGPGVNRTTEYKYPFNFSTSVYESMKIKKLNSAPIETIVDSGAGGGEKVDYEIFNGSYIYPSIKYRFGAREPGEYCNQWQNGNWVAVNKYSQYNSFGLPTLIEYGCNSISTQNVYVEDLLIESNYGLKSTINEYNNKRLLKSSVDHRAYINDYAYDKLNRLVAQITRVDNNWITQWNPIIMTKSVVYTMGGIGFEINNIETGIDGYYKETKNIHNETGLLLSSELTNHSANGTPVSITYQYDVNNRKVKTNNPFNANGFEEISYEFNHLSRPVEVIPAGSQSSITYQYAFNNNELQGIPPTQLFRTGQNDENNNASFEYVDLLGRKRFSRNFIVSDPPTGNLWAVTRFDYNSRDQITKITSPEGNFFEYNYNADGTLQSKKIVGQDNPYTYVYNSRDLLWKTIYPDGSELRIVYDDYDQPLKQYYNNILVKEIEYFPYNQSPLSGAIKWVKTKTTDGNLFEEFFIAHDDYGRAMKKTETYPYNTVNTQDIIYDGPVMISQVKNNFSGAVGVGSIVYDEFTEYGADKATLVFDGVRFYPPSSPDIVNAGSTMSYMSNNWLSSTGLGIYSIGYGYHDKGLVTNVNAVGNTGTPTPICGTGTFIFECDSIPWVIMDPKIWFDYMVVNDTVHYGNLVISLDYLQNDTIFNHIDSVFISFHDDLTHSDTLYYNRNYYGDFEGFAINEQNYEYNIGLMIQDLSVRIPIFDPGLTNGGDILIKINDEFYRKVIPTVCDTLIYEEEALLFGQILHYEEAKPHFRAPSQYNGNVSSIIWQILWGERQAYGFRYDQLNRLVNAHYAVYKPDLSISTDNRFGVQINGYDKDGNVQKIQRRGVIGECEDGFEYGIIDNLGYSYSNGRLLSVSEGGETDKGYPYSGGSFSYDPNGNVTSLGDRGLLIEYDHNFMPKVMYLGPVSRIEYNYAGTRKLSSKYFDENGVLQEAFNYYGKAIVRNDEFYSLECSSARIVLDEDDNKYKAQYHIKDYLGHIRLTIWDRDNDGLLTPDEVLYSSDYYPFGMRIDNYFSRMPEDEEDYMRRGLSGNEEEPRTRLYDFHARLYDPSLGRFMGVDVMAEKMPAWSPYNYCFNNPIFLTDSDGRWPNPPFGYRISAGVSLGSGGFAFNITASVGIQYKNSFAQVGAFATGSAYMGGNQLGTSSMTRGIQWDATFTGLATIGGSSAQAHNMYSINYNMASPFTNDFGYSATYGQALNYNSSVNAEWDGSYGNRVQRSGIVGLKIGNFSLQTSNDTGRLGGDGGDRANTGAGLLNFGGVEVGYQNFTGAYNRGQEPEFGGTCAFGCLYNQSEYQQSLNQSFYFIRGNGISIEGGPNNGGVQNFIHSKTNTGLFNYPSNFRINIGGSLETSGN